MTKITLVFILLMLLPGCATHLAESGRRIKVASTADSAQLKGCEQLGRVRGEADSFLSGGGYGVAYATNDARNKAGRIPGADTLELVDDEPRRLGGEVAGIVYNCLTPGFVTVQPPAAPPQRNVPSGTTGLPAATKIPDSIFEKARKCQNKGGVWVNDSCIIPID
jgi:hypothetical protein